VIAVQGERRREGHGFLLRIERNERPDVEIDRPRVSRLRPREGTPIFLRSAMVAAAGGGLAGQSSIGRDDTFKASGFGSYHTVAKPACSFAIQVNKFSYKCCKLYWPRLTIC
jgi:hypothetical protein